MNAWRRNAARKEKIDEINVSQGKTLAKRGLNTAGCAVKRPRSRAYKIVDHLNMALIRLINSLSLSVSTLLKRQTHIVPLNKHEEVSPELESPFPF